MVEIGNIKKEIKKYRYIYMAVFFIFILGVFLRVYNFGSWMHFELDQARDIFIVKNAVDNGAENLPLLGPQARGKELYLGPIFYYFSYVTSLIFGVSPEAMALPDLIFSVLSILLFYLFARNFFSRWISVMLLSIVATSLFLITYGRFAWNPNSMFFWSLLTFHSLLKAGQNKEFNIKWFLLFAFGFGILTQLHFIAFIAAPITALVYILITRMHIPWKILVWSLSIIFILYSPVIFSEIQSGGKNINSFFSSVELSDGVGTIDDKEDGANRGFIEKTFRAFQESSTFYWSIISSDNNGRYNIRVKKDSQTYLRIVCNENCKKALPHHLMALSALVFSLGFFVYTLIRIYYKRKKLENLKVERLYHSYLLIFLWLFFGGIFLILVAYQISPRFYLYLVVPFLILFGLLLEKIKNIEIWGKYIAIAIVVFLTVTNLYITKKYFNILNEAQVTKNQIVWKDIVMNQNDIVTLKQLREAASRIRLSQGDLEKFIIIGDNRYARAFYYIVTVENNNKNALCYMKVADFEAEQLAGVTYYVLLRNKSETQISQNMLSLHHIEEKYNFGTINLYKMVPNENTNKTILPSQCFNK